MKPRSKKFKGKKFTWIGEGGMAKVWRVEGMAGKRKKGTIIRRQWNPAFTRNATPLIDELELEMRFLANKIAFEFFPKNVVKVTSMDKKTLSLRSKEVAPDKALKKWTEALLRLKRLEKGQASPENKRKTAALRRELEALYEKVMDRRDDPFIRILEKEFRAAGIVFDPSPENYSLKKPRQPVCYDIDEVKINQAWDYLWKQGYSKGKRERIGKLLTAYEEAWSSWRKELEGLGLEVPEHE